jgi:hypothetical protein
MLLPYLSALKAWLGRGLGGGVNQRRARIDLSERRGLPLRKIKVCINFPVPCPLFGVHYTFSLAPRLVILRVG